MRPEDLGPPLRDVIAAHGLSARKGLGQHFLLDLNLTRRIARAAGPLSGVRVLEVGPGPGGLTRALLLEGAAEVVAIERDRRCLEALADLAARADGRLRLVEGDALAMDGGALFPAGGGPVRVIANLPYNISTALLLGWLFAEPWPPWYQSLTLMFQREVAERLSAVPSTKAYGRLSVLTQWRFLVERCFDVPAEAFTPKPSVVSRVVLLTPRPTPIEAPARALEEVLAAAFGQRRKMLRQSLSRLGDAEALLARAGIAPTLRAEALDVEAFARLARAHAADCLSASAPHATVPPNTEHP